MLAFLKYKAKLRRYGLKAPAVLFPDQRRNHR